jgi:hypothetical protein
MENARVLMEDMRVHPMLTQHTTREVGSVVGVAWARRISTWIAWAKEMSCREGRAYRHLPQ